MENYAKDFAMRRRLTRHSSHLVPTLALLMAVAPTASLAAPQAERRTDMETSRKADLKTVEGPAEYFTGKATITGQFQRPAPSRVTGAFVSFEPGARTAWHTHPL